MRVALINTDIRRGGAAKAVVRLADALRNQPSPVHVNVFHCSDRERNTIVRGLRRPMSRVLNAVLFRAFGESGIIDFGVADEILESVADYDIIHLHNLHGYYLDYGRLLAHLANRPVVWTWHDMWGATGRCGSSVTCEKWHTGCGHCPHLNFYPAAWLDWSGRDYRRKGDVLMSLRNLRIVSPSAWMARIAAARGFPPDRIHTIPNVVDLRSYTRTSRMAARKTVGLKPHETCLLFVAADCRDTRKGFEDFAEITRNLGVSGVALGAPPESVPPHIRAAGVISTAQELATYYSACDAYVTTSRIDNYPNTVIEAQSCGTPVFGYATGGIAEQVPGFWQGIIPASDPDELERKIRAWLEDEMRDDDGLAMALRQHAENVWDPAVVAQQHMVVYAAALGDNQP